MQNMFLYMEVRNLQAVWDAGSDYNTFAGQKWLRFYLIQWASLNAPFALYPCLNLLFACGTQNRHQWVMSSRITDAFQTS